MNSPTTMDPDALYKAARDTLMALIGLAGSLSTSPKLRIALAIHHPTAASLDAHLADWHKRLKTLRPDDREAIHDILDDDHAILRDAEDSVVTEHADSIPWWGQLDGDQGETV
ncbi:hypothetical protein ACL02S_23135 [Nocardia sp. 004]|uniref:hypothetical protein n=1 Tax=Nocardia sp. 004 TaxID=3385978 RepID=UPI0039A01B21